MNPLFLSSRKNVSKIFALVLMQLCLLSATGAIAQGDLLVTPKRVVFEGSKRSEELNLANIGKDTATFVISFIQIRMKNDGAFEKISEPDSGQLFADKNIRFFPRTVTLAPNEAQTVKVQITKTAQLAAGEYRSHLYFRAVPKEKPLGEKQPEKDSSISVRLVPVFGISMPVIIRVGESTADVGFSGTSLELTKDQAPSLKLTLNRTGNMSVYGDLSVNHISSEGKTTPIGSVKGLAVYTPNASRQFRLLLNNTAGI
ncbi:MAG TPA: hypothetical protein VF609_01260, partial [Flavisolibacter sp.]